MEKRLAEYRTKKAREEKINQVKSKVHNIFSKYFSSAKAEPPNEENEVTELLLLESDNNLEINDEEIKQEEDDLNCCSYTDMLYYCLWFILWATLYAIFIKLQFGIVYLIVSAIIGICLNTRTSPKKSNEISAYSVFNKNCESIDGTLKAEQFEREIRYGPSGIR